MPHYFLHVRNGTYRTIDTEGADYVDLDGAKREAVKSARELVSQSALSGSALELNRIFEIANDAGSVVAIVDFREAFPSD